MPVPTLSGARLIVPAAVVFIASFVGLAWNITRDGIATGYSDPVAKIRAQDEAVYVNSAMTMVRDGDWLTPKVMGRLFFQKPPLLIWMSAFSTRIFGLSLFAVRLPAILLGALGIAVAFVWCARLRSPTAGIVAAALLFLNPSWQMLSRLSYTDVLASGFSILAVLAAAIDHRLERHVSRILFGAAGAAAVLSKSVAGLLPFAALLLYWLLAPSGKRPRFLAIFEIAIVAAAVAGPWHLYQTVVHPQWFWADYIQQQLFGVGMNAAQNGIFHRSPVFWLQRLAQMDPLLLSLAALSFVVGLQRIRLKIRPQDLLLICWMLVVAGALCAFQAKNLPYLVFLLPPLCIFIATAGPGFLDAKPLWTVAALTAVFVVKAIIADAPWSLRPAAPPLQGARAMRTYYELGRDTDLILVDPDDEFYSATLPLPEVRYCFVDPRGAIARAVPHYVPLGITLTAAEFSDLPSLTPRFERQFQTWHANAKGAIASAIVLQSPADLAMLLRARPQSDFYTPAGWPVELHADHDLLSFSADRVFFLSRTAPKRPTPLPRIPHPW